ncbi:GAD-like domain-containing protein [Brucella anthropi]|uniref:GAD-like domain-containing protein n=1 Tax=Brucella anthropi TaxID=529 RepID=UPI000774E972|nr:GAD-like domain-containing protein [Brucella anthropi]KXO72950.1 hypothetical protein AYJ56_17305 [Brucella anthropi]
MPVIHENFQYALDEYGPVKQIRRASNKELSQLREVLPHTLVDFIEEKGFCSFHNGLFTMCNPEEMRVVIAQVFGGDNDFHHGNCHVFGYTAFGVLYCWSDKLYNFRIELPLNVIYCRALTAPENWPPRASAEHIASGMIPDQEEADFLDVDGNPMFAACQRVYGANDASECYGFFPALAIAGAFGPAQDVGHIKRVKALEHFTFLAQLRQFYLMKSFSGGLQTVRSIGAN